MSSSNDVIAKSWQHNYIGIQQCNVVLNRIDGVSMEASKIKVVKGEMKFLRALMYFNLVRIFGDVPLVTQETTDANAYFGQGRTPVSEVYAQIITDLTESIDELPAKVKEKSKASQSAAQALLGHVYLTLGEYAKANQLFQAVASYGYRLLDNPDDIFDVANKGNDEVIFEVQFESGLNGNSEGSNAFCYFSPSGSVNGAKGHNLPTPEVYALFSDSDKRKTAYFRQTAVHVATNKLRQTSTVVSDGGSNVIVMRYADVLLMMSECYAHLGDLPSANACLNSVKSRAGVPLVNISGKEALLDEIALERRKELVCEGKRWFDLIRTGKAIEVMTEYFSHTVGYNGVVVRQEYLVQPIPLSQIDCDPSIVQNAGYN